MRVIQSSCRNATAGGIVTRAQQQQRYRLNRMLYIMPRHTTTPHADSQTLLISTTLAVRARRHCHLTPTRILAFKLVTVASIAQEERLNIHTQFTLNTAAQHIPHVLQPWSSKLVNLSLGPFHGDIAVPSVTRCHCRRRCCCRHRCAGGVRRDSSDTIEWQCGVRRLAVANGPNIFSNASCSRKRKRFKQNWNKATVHCRLCSRHPLHEGLV